jgi:hypothetical protein
MHAVVRPFTTASPHHHRQHVAPLLATTSSDRQREGSPAYLITAASIFFFASPSIAQDVTDSGASVASPAVAVLFVAATLALSVVTAGVRDRLAQLPRGQRFDPTFTYQVAYLSIAGFLDSRTEEEERAKLESPLAARYAFLARTMWRQAPGAHASTAMQCSPCAWRWCVTDVWARCCGCGSGRCVVSVP